MIPHSDYETVAASQSDQVLGPTGKLGDILSGLTIVPATTGAGAVSIKDGGGSAITVFTGGVGSLTELRTVEVNFGPHGLRSVNAGGWKVTTGANVSVIARGRFR
jgi:hypothetical protein